MFCCSPKNSILIVEDDPAIRTSLRALLERAGYLVEDAEDGIDALNKIQDHAPDLIISDLGMPNMNGMELLRVLQVMLPEVPTIATSGSLISTNPNARPAADAFYQKGCSPQELLTLISSLLVCRATADARQA